MKILLATFSDNPDHQDITFGMYENLYNAKRSEHEIWLLGTNKPKVPVLNTKNAHLVACPKKPGIEKKTFDIKELFSIIRWINRENFDVIFFETLHVWNLAIMFRAKKNIRIYQMIHDLIPHEGDRQAKTVDLMNKAVCKMADYIVLANRKYLLKATEIYGIDSDRIRYVDLWRRFPEYTEPCFEKRVLFFGRMNPYKGVDNFLKIVKLCPEVQFIAVGRVDPQVQNFVDQLKLFPNVTLIDRYVNYEEMEGFFKKSDWVILPYHTATQSGVVIDSCRYGRPCIAFNVGAVSEQINEGINGYLIEQGNIEAFAKKLRDAVQMDREQFEELSKSTYEFGIKKYDVNGAVDRFINLFLPLNPGHRI